MVLMSLRIYLFVSANKPMVSVDSNDAKELNKLCIFQPAKDRWKCSKIYAYMRLQECHSEIANATSSLQMVYDLHFLDPSEVAI